MIIDKKKNQKKICLFAPAWQNNSTRRGFSLIEILFTLLILTVAITAIIALMTKSIVSVQDSKNQIISAQLAQEGVELVRNYKDNGNLNIAAYNNAGNHNNLRIDRNLNFLNGGEKLLQIDANGFYAHTAGVPTKFNRRIDLSIIGTWAASGSTRTITATSYVTWRNGGFGVLALPAGCTLGNECVSVVSVMPDIN